MPRYAEWHSTVLAWVLALPMLTGLVHGLPAAILLTAAVAAGLQVEMPERWTALADAFVASGVVGLLAGHLSDMRRSALAAAEQKLAVQSQQLEQQYRQYQVLRTSHALLTERTSAQEWSVAASVEAAQRLVREGPVVRSANALLALLESQAMVRVAAVYLEQSPSKLAPGPIATLGVHEPVSSHVLAVRSAFELGELVVPRSSPQGHDSATQEIVLAVPLLTSAGRVFGVVAVYELPFVATHDAHFRLIATLASSVADALLEQVDAAESTVPALQPAFATPRLLHAPDSARASGASLSNATSPGHPAPAWISGEPSALAEEHVSAESVVVRPVIAVRPLPLPRPAAPSISHALEGRLPLPGAFQMPAETMPIKGPCNEPPAPPSQFGGSVVAPLPAAPSHATAHPGSAPRPIPASRRRAGAVSSLHEVSPSDPLQYASGA